MAVTGTLNSNCQEINEPEHHKALHTMYVTRGQKDIDWSPVAIKKIGW
jgi:hypothetical protein